MQGANNNRKSSFTRGLRLFAQVCRWFNTALGDTQRGIRLRKRNNSLDPSNPLGGSIKHFDAHSADFCLPGHMDIQQIVLQAKDTGNLAVELPGNVSHGMLAGASHCQCISSIIIFFKAEG